MTLCLTCRNEDSCVETDLRKIRGECEYYKPTTNADRIRSMTDEELTQFLFCYGGSAPNCRVSKIVNGCTSCRICWLDWLKQETEEGE